MAGFGDTFARTGSVQFDFPPDVVFRAIAEALPGLQGFRVLDTNPTARHFSVATAVSAWSWGERVTISVTELAAGKSAVSIGSATKTMIGSVASHSKNRKNVERLIRATSDVLERSGSQWTAELGVAPQATATGGDTSDPRQMSAAAVPQSPILIADELAKLSALRNEGVLTEAEFAAMKLRLLGHLESAASVDTTTDADDETSSSDAKPTTPAPDSYRPPSGHDIAETPVRRIKKGWHPDPRGEAALRWHDGKNWSPHTR